MRGLASVPGGNVILQYFDDHFILAGFTGNG